MPESLTLRCPVRGRLKVSGRSADGLSPTEEVYRVEAVKYLIGQGFPVENFVIEPVIKRFGNAGRNSFRADFAVLDRPAAGLAESEDFLTHAVLLGEVKRDSADASAATQYQVKPLLNFANRSDCVAIYWDNVNQVAFWRVQEGNSFKTLEGPVEVLPKYGATGGVQELSLHQLRSDSPLREVFARIEDILHAASIGPSRRFGLMLQLLLAKIYDENNAKTHGGTLGIQDYRSLDRPFPGALRSFNQVLGAAEKYYQRHLPEKIEPRIDLPESTFFAVMAILAPHRVTSASQSVVQDFYMYFAKGLYKWDLAQYFTPPAITEFIVDVISPSWDEDVLDPACGSADFLTATFRRGVSAGFDDYASKVWGADVSQEAVQVAVLNMVLNGDGKSNISSTNSLESVDQEAGRWDVLICNPPFGKKILERSPQILSNYDLGYPGGDRHAGVNPLDKQESGILFAELCVRLARPGSGRIAIILPNGYLGNTSAKYFELRRWLLMNARIAAVIGLPRFTFKSSGADVSASIVFLERLESPVEDLRDLPDYDIAFEMINNVGWSTGDKKGAPTFVRDQNDGSLVLDEDLEPVLEEDFSGILKRLSWSEASAGFSWLGRPVGGSSDGEGSRAQSVSIASVLQDELLTLDVKRHSTKNREIVDATMSVPHVRLGDIVDILPEADARTRRKIVHPAKTYRYVELARVESGAYIPELLRGWQLPDRARHLAAAGDFYVGAVWGSVRKWFVLGEGETDVLVTNGMHRMRLKPGCEEYAVDLVAALCSEAMRIQMRALTRGSDGLAELRPEDLARIVIPKVTDPGARAELQPFVDSLLRGLTGVEAAVRAVRETGNLSGPDPEPRTSHVHLV